jgi:site-specific DNA recombinase
MGRLTLNVLLSFAQFEREVTSERIRDKIAASKRKGMWMGGCHSLGYDVVDRRLVVNPKEAEVVKLIYETYLRLVSVRDLKEHLERQEIVSKVRTSKTGSQTGGCSFSRGALYELLANPLYIGEVRHKKERHPGQHEAILGRDIWERVQQRLSDTAVRSGTDEPKCIPSQLARKLFDEYGGRLTPSPTVKGGRRYRYYVSRNLIRSSAKGKKGWRLTALELERSVITAASSMLADRAAILAAVPDAETSAVSIDAALQAAEAAKTQLDSDLDKSAVIARLVHRVELRKGGMQVALDLGSFVNEEHRELRERLKITRLVPLRSGGGDSKCAW